MSTYTVRIGGQSPLGGLALSIATAVVQDYWRDIVDKEDADGS